MRVDSHVPVSISYPRTYQTHVTVAKSYPRLLTEAAYRLTQYSLTQSHIPGTPLIAAASVVTLIQIPILAVTFNRAQIFPTR